MSNSVWPHKQQPARLLHPWDSPGKNTGVGCHFLLQCMHVFSCFSGVQLCATLWTAAHQASLSTGFSGQEYWSGLPFPSPKVYIVSCFNPLMYSKVITTIVLANTCGTSSNYDFFFIMRMFSVYYISNFQICNTILLMTIPCSTLDP